MEKIRYSYRKAKEGFQLDKIKCPVCGSHNINWHYQVQDKSWNGTIVLLAECWSGDIDIKNPQHIFLIELNDLPTVKIKKVKRKK